MIEFCEYCAMEKIKQKLRYKVAEERKLNPGGIVKLANVQNDQIKIW